MKKITLLALTFGWCLSLTAQEDPISRTLFQQLWPDIITHDSIVYSEDTGAAFFPETMVSIWLFANDQYDSAKIYDQGTLSGIYDGEHYPDSTVVFDMYNFFGPLDTAGKYVFLHGANGRDTAMLQYYFNGSDFELEQKLKLNYSSNGELNNIEIFLDLFGSGSLSLYGAYDFYRSANRVDSLIFSDVFSGVFVKIINEYVNNRLETSYFLELDSADFDTTGLYNFTYNSQGEIIIVHENYYEESSGSFELDYNWYYYQRQNTNISRPEARSKGLSLYPSPVQEYFRLEGADSMEHFRILSSNGQVLMQGKLDHEVSVSGLPKGIYLLELSNDLEKQVTRFQKF